MRPGGTWRGIVSALTPTRIRALHTRLLFVISLLLWLATFNTYAAEPPTLVSTVIRGSTVYSTTQLFEIYRDQLGKPITSESARAIVTGIARKYREDGYSQPSIRIDDRMTGAGILVLEVTETRISTIEIAGNPGPYESELRELGHNIGRDADLLRARDLQSALHQMRSLAGLDLTATTEQDSELQGSYRLNLDTDFQAVSSTARISNRGTDEIGPEFLLGQTTFNGLFDGRATLGLLYATTSDYDEYHGLGLNGRTRLTGKGLALTVSGFRSRSNPHERLIDRDDRYLRDRAELSFERQALDLDAGRLTVDAGIRSEDLAIDRSGNRLRDERLRLLELGARWVKTPGRSAQYALGLHLIQGLNGMGSGLRAADLATDLRRADFTMLELDYVRVARIGTHWNWRLNVLGQHSNYVVPYSERFKIGGDRLGRGFEVAEISGDRGLGARVELGRQVPAISWRERRVSAYFTYDLAAAWKNDIPGRESAATGGVGLALTSDSIRGRIEFAKPLTHPDVEGREDLSVFAELAVNW